MAAARHACVVVAVYLAAAVMLTWPLATGFYRWLGVLEGLGDPFPDLWVLGWGIRSWQQDPWGTLAGRAFDAPIFHPAPLTRTYLDHQLLQALAAAPVDAFTGSLTVAYNAILMGSLAASGLAMHVLARAVIGSTAGAFMAGLAWTCWPYRTAQLLHVQLQALCFMPLALWALARVAARRRWRDSLWLGLAAGLQAVVLVDYGVMTAVALVVAAPALGWVTGQWRAPRYWSRVLLAGAIAALVLLPVARPYLSSTQADGPGRSLDEASTHAASIQSYTQVPPDNLIYGRSGLLAPRAPARGSHDWRPVDHQMFPGLVLLTLAGCGVWVGRRSDARALVMTATALVLAGWWLSVGPEGPLGLYRLFAATIPGFDAIRAPARFGVLAMLGLALLAALGLARTVTSRPGGRRLATLVIGAMLLEYLNAPLAFVEAPATDTPIGRWLRDAPEPGPVLYLPLGDDGGDTRLMLQALQHGRPIVNGYGEHRPSSFTAIQDALAALPGVEGLDMLRELGVRYVVAEANRPLGSADSPLMERARLDDVVIYEVRWPPESEAAQDATPAVERPPPPGVAPFPAGEEANYAVTWIGDLPAGTIMLRADRAGPAETEEWPLAAWRFEAAASTAAWVSRFYEARDVFRSLAAPDLLPLVQTRDVDEGARQYTRAYVYDRDRQHVRTGATVSEAKRTDALTSPLVGGARDAVTALFYVRTLSLTPGRDFAIPVNDAGRPLTARIRVQNREVLGSPTGSVETFRLAIGLDRRTERRDAVEATLWISTDARRVPVRLDMAAGFGRLRVELVDYRP